MSAPDESDPHGDRVAEDVELGRITARAAGHRDADVIATLVIIAERLGRIEDTVGAVARLLDERIPGDLDNNLDTLVELVRTITGDDGEMIELVRRKLLGHPLP